ncbi:MAG: SAM-dependent methyltransferase [Pseudomonadota bacterium]
MSDIVPFLRAWVANPKRVAAITPSGPALAELMTRDLGPETGPVLELGPGTGVFTRAILAHGVAPQDLTLIEFSPDFAHTLARRFPDCRILCMDAARLGTANLYSDDAKPGAVISGLPILSMNARQIMGILGGSFTLMRPNGAFYQFTYGPRCPVPHQILTRLGLKAQRVGATMRNVPPSTVYRITHAPEHLHPD